MQQELIARHKIQSQLDQCLQMTIAMTNQGDATVEKCRYIVQDCLQMIYELYDHSSSDQMHPEIPYLESRLKMINAFQTSRLDDLLEDEALYSRYCLIQTADTIRRLMGHLS